MFVDNWSKKIRAPSQRDPFGVGAVYLYIIGLKKSELLRSGMF